MKLITTTPYCKSSPDYTSPIGATHDDTTNLSYIEALEEHYGLGHPLVTLELGCAGGRIVKDLADRGHDAYGIEGTPYPLQMRRPAWVEYYGTRLFNHDLSQPFVLQDSAGADMQFDIISHWEFLEHLPPQCLPYLHAKLYTHLKEDGIILAGISPWGPTTNRDRFEDTDPRKTLALEVEHHQSCFWREEWEELYWNKLFDCHDYPLGDAKLRWDGCHKIQAYSIYVSLTRKNTPEAEEIARQIIQECEKEWLLEIRRSRILGGPDEK